MKPMLIAFFGVSLLCCNGKAQQTGEYHSANAGAPSHSLWNDLVQRHVRKNGDVDYSAIQQEMAQLDAYLNLLGQHGPSSTWTKAEKLAYYINLYNAATVKLIADHYPVKSIKDIPNRWEKNWIWVGKKQYSLNDIEHNILRKMDEPRIHFAINCASFSCPKLVNWAYTAKNIEEQLEAVAKDFINDPSRNRFGEGSAELSKIFKWYKGDFTTKSSLLHYIGQYLSRPLPTSTSIDYLDYDWTLNDAK